MPKIVPVVDYNQIPLMPTTPARAAKWIKSGKATPFWKKGIFCVRLNQEPSARNYQEIACGIDPGSKREGFTLKSSKHHYLNIQSVAVDWVKKQVKTRREMRRSRRYRQTPCRQPRWNRLAHKIRLVPSTKARWQWKLRIANWLSKIYPTKKEPKRKVISLHSLETGKRLTQSANPKDLQFLTYNTWRTRYLAA